MSNSISGSGLSAELLLNKIMNGQVRTESGNTVTIGSRARASELNREALDPSISSANVKAYVGYATAIQSNLSELKGYLENYGKALAGATLTSSVSLSKNATAHITAVGTTNIDGTPVFGGATAATNGITVDIGLGGSLVLGNYAIATDLTDLQAAITALEAGVAADYETLADDVQTELDAALEIVNSHVGVAGMHATTLQNRSDVLDDMAIAYSDAASQQFVVGTGGAGDLLGNVLG